MLCSCEQLIVFEDRDAILLSRTDSPDEKYELRSKKEEAAKKRVRISSLFLILPSFPFAGATSAIPILTKKSRQSISAPRAASQI